MKTNALTLNEKVIFIKGKKYMSFLEKLKLKAQQKQNESIFADKEVAAPTLERIGEQVTGGKPKVWCKAHWAKGCDFT